MFDQISTGRQESIEMANQPPDWAIIESPEYSKNLEGYQRQRLTGSW